MQGPCQLQYRQGLSTLTVLRLHVGTDRVRRSAQSKSGTHRIVEMIRPCSLLA